MMEKKKNAVVVGATGNLGGAVSRALKNKGFVLDPVWLSSDRPDATKPESYNNLPEEIHCAVYVAGINIVKKAVELTLEEWNQVLAVNLTGAFLFACAAYPKMVKAKGATFVVISSIMVTHPYPNRIAYTASKAGLEGLVRSLAVEWGEDEIFTHGIRLGHLEGLMKSTKIDPEFLDAVRSKTPSHRLIKPESVADFIVWLADGGSRSMSGTIIDFDPAYTINRNPLL